MLKIAGRRLIACRFGPSRAHLGGVPIERPPLLLRVPSTSGDGPGDAPWRAVSVVGVDPSTTIGDLSQSLGMVSVPGGGVLVDGRRVGPNVAVVASGIRLGSVVERVPEHRPCDPVVWIVSVAGPDSGRVVALQAGRHVIGSGSGASCRFTDASLSTHHAVLDVDPGGKVEITDLGIGRPVLVGGESGTGARQVAPRVRVTIGATEFVVQRPVPVDPPHDARREGEESDDSWTVPVHRHATHAMPQHGPLRPPELESAVPGGPSGVGFASLGTTVLTGVVVAVLFRQPVMLVLALVGAVGAIAVTGWQSFKARRAETRRVARNRDSVERFERAVEARARIERKLASRRMPWLVTGSRCLLHTPWARRRSDDEAWVVGLGVGDVEWRPPVDHRSRHEIGAESGDAGRPMVLRNVVVPFQLAPGTTLGIVGTSADRLAVVRALVIQRTVALGPADLAIAIVTDRPQDWEWAAWLPHRAAPDVGVVHRPAGLDALLGARSTEAARVPLLVVLDGDDQLATRTGTARRLLDLDPAGTATLVAIAPDRPVPSRCTAALHLGTAGHAELVVFREVGDLSAAGGSLIAGRRCSVVGPGQVQRLRSIGITSATAHAVAATLAGRSDPEASAAAGSLPPDVDLLALLGDAAADGESIAAAWERGGDDPPAVARIGCAADGVVELDLVADGPHALIAGTTGAGKSELLRSLVVGLAAASPPELLSFVLVDYKGGSAFDACGALPHVVGVVTDLDHRLGARVLRSLEAELRHRERVLRAAGAPDLAAHRAGGGDAGALLARLVVVVDEFATLAAELPEFLNALVNVAQRGRSLGVHLVLATQRPSGVLSDDIRANTNLRVALRVQDPGDSLDVVGDRSAARLPRDSPGRAIVRLGPEERVTFQAARCTGPHRATAERSLRIVPMQWSSAEPVDDGSRARPSDVLGGDCGPTVLEVLVARIRDAADRRGVREVRRPWCDPLPAVLTAAGLPAPACATVGPGAGAGAGDRVVGAIDVVAEQRRDPLTWRRSDGHLLVAGALGAGVSSTLAAVAVAAAADGGTLYVVDGASSSELAWLGDLPACVGVVRGDQPERLAQMLTRLESHPNGGVDGAPSVVVVDGVGSLRARLGSPENAELADRLDQLVLEASSGSMRFVFGAERPAALPIAWSATCGQKWIGRVTDPLDAMTGGYPSSAALPMTAPPGRFLVAVHDGLAMEAQVVAPTEVREWAGAPRPSRSRQVVKLVELPAVFDRLDLGVQPARGGGKLQLPVGRRIADLELAVIEFHDGDHLMVAGPARSGRTSFLQLLAEQWARAEPEGAVVQIDARVERRHGDAKIAGLTSVEPDRPMLLLIDDADRFDDAGGVLANLLTSDHPGITVVAAGRPEALRSVGYGHWTALVRRSRRGVLLGAVQDLDADVLGVHVPRRALPRGPVPIGRAVLVADGRHDAVQLALPTRLGPTCRDAVLSGAGR